MAQDLHPTQLRIRSRCTLLTVVGTVGLASTGVPSAFWRLKAYFLCDKSARYFIEEEKQQEGTDGAVMGCWLQLRKAGLLHCLHWSTHSVIFSYRTEQSPAYHTSSVMTVEDIFPGGFCQGSRDR